MLVLNVVHCDAERGRCKGGVDFVRWADDGTH